ncbi:MAG: hypothetical protein HY352_00335 [Candidatus Omnitrophica bacterium]|nr:hypothetical protein [Candidatus Omnitrophota bacterium]
MRHIVRAVSVLLAAATIGCAGYCPVRWPKRELWASSVASPPPIRLPATAPSDGADVMRKEGVAVVARLLNPAQTRQVFHAHLVRNGAQPLVLSISNDSDQPYHFRKGDVDPRYIPATRAARWAVVHPAITATRLVSWMVMIVPGLLFECLIEPLTTLDFPGVEEASQRPSAPNNRTIREDFIRQEIADGDIGPREQRTGVLFLRPPKLGRVIPVTLINAHTQQPLIFEVHTPASVYVDERIYPYPSARVWEAVAKTVKGIASWRVTSSDQASGRITVKTGTGFWRWSTRTQITLTVEAVDAQHTRVRVERTLRGDDTRALGRPTPTIERLISELEALLPRAPSTRSTSRGASLDDLQDDQPPASDQPPDDVSGDGASTPHTE